MPTYEYACTECGNRVDVFQRIDDEPLTVCERCGGTLRKVFHPAGIVFKGSGFYATDSRSKAGSKGGRDGDGTAGSGATSKKAGESSKESKESKGSKAAPASESSG